MAVESGGHKVAFTSDKVEELLRPELEDGSISWNDYERTKRFAAVNRTYWPTMTGTLSAAFTVYYGHWYRRRPWSKSSLLLVAPVAYAVGTFPGAIAQMVAVRRFRTELEDPNGVLEALGRRVRLVALTASGDRGSTVVPTSYPSNSVSSDRITQEDSEAEGDVSKGRWAEIRKASGTAMTSTWDSIRQAHKQSKVRQPQQSDVSLEGQGDRQDEQAKFDALLEAERKMSS